MKIDHYDLVHFLYTIGIKKGYIPIKEYSLTNLNEVIEERIDCVWLDKKDGKVIFAFEVEEEISKLKNKERLYHFKNSMEIIFKKGILNGRDYKIGFLQGDRYELSKIEEALKRWKCL